MRLYKFTITLCILFTNLPYTNGTSHHQIRPSKKLKWWDGEVIQVNLTFQYVIQDLEVVIFINKIIKAREPCDEGLIKVCKISEIK